MVFVTKENYDFMYWKKILSSWLSKKISCRFLLENLLKYNEKMKFDCCFINLITIWVFFFFEMTMLGVYIFISIMIHKTFSYWFKHLHLHLLCLPKALSLRCRYVPKIMKMPLPPFFSFRCPGRELNRHLAKSMLLV